jgi:hypothetical protein
VGEDGAVVATAQTAPSWLSSVTGAGPDRDECDSAGAAHWDAVERAQRQRDLLGKETGPNPTDRGKGGVKRRLLTEASGIPLAIEIDGANRHDMKLVEATLAS